MKRTFATTLFFSTNLIILSLLIVSSSHAFSGIIDKEVTCYWDGRSNVGEKVASGVYYYTLRAGDFTATRKMVVVK